MTAAITPPIAIWREWGVRCRQADDLASRVRLDIEFRVFIRKGVACRLLPLNTVQGTSCRAARQTVTDRNGRGSAGEYGAANSPTSGSPVDCPSEATYRPSRASVSLSSTESSPGWFGS